MPDTSSHRIPTWLLGRHVTALTVYPCTVSPTYSLSVGEGQSLVGCVDEIGLEMRVSTEELSPMTTAAMNEEWTVSGVSLRLTEILNAAGSNILAATAVGGSPLVYVVFTRGAQVWYGNFRVGAYREGVRRGKSVATLDLLPCHLNSATAGAPPVSAVGYSSAAVPSYAASVPAWLQGKHVTDVEIKVQTVDAAGSLADLGASSNYTLTGSVEEIRLRVEVELKDVTPTASRYENNVEHRRRFVLTLREVMKNYGVNILAAAASYTYYHITFKRGGQSWSTYAILSTYDEELRRGKCVSTLEVARCGLSLSYT